MDIEQLRDIVKRKDGEGFCQFFRQLKAEEVLRLSREEYQEIMNLAEKLGRERIIRDDSLFAFLFNTTRKYLNISIRSLDVLPTSLISLFYGNLFHNIYPDHDENFASILMFMGICLSRLTNQGIKKAIQNLKQAIECLDEAAAIFKIVKVDLNYARTLSNKGVTFLTLAEQGVNTIDNLKQSIKCYDEAIPILKKEKAEIDYARIQMNRGVSLTKLAEKGVDVERNFASAIEFYQEAEGIFLEKGSLLDFIKARANRIVGLWWRFQNTNEEDYLIQARNLCEEALEFAPHKTHLAKERIIELLNKINGILADRYLVSKKEPRIEIEEEIKKLELLPEILQYVKQIPGITEKVNIMDKKLDEILNSIRNQTKQIIETIKRSGEKVIEEVAKGFTSLADDLRVLNEEQRRKLLEELCRVLTNSTFQNKFLRESSPKKRGLIKSIFQRIEKKAKELAGHIPAALAAHQIFSYFDWLWVEVLHLTPIHPALVLGMVIFPFLAKKDSISKS